MSPEQANKTICIQECPIPIQRTPNTKLHQRMLSFANVLRTSKITSKGANKMKNINLQACKLSSYFFVFTFISCIRFSAEPMAATWANCTLSMADSLGFDKLRKRVTDEWSGKDGFLLAPCASVLQKVVSTVDTMSECLSSVLVCNSELAGIHLFFWELIYLDRSQESVISTKTSWLAGYLFWAQKVFCQTRTFRKHSWRSDDWRKLGQNLKAIQWNTWKPFKNDWGVIIQKNMIVWFHAETSESWGLNILMFFESTFWIAKPHSDIELPNLGVIFLYILSWGYNLGLFPSFPLLTSFYQICPIMSLQIIRENLRRIGGRGTACPPKKKKERKITEDHHDNKGAGTFQPRGSLSCGAVCRAFLWTRSGPSDSIKKPWDK